jgi:hypothetical protein
MALFRQLSNLFITDIQLSFVDIQQLLGTSTDHRHFRNFPQFVGLQRSFAKLAE